MITTAQVLYRFFSSFGIPAYSKSNVPDVIGTDGDVSRPEMPYITYEIKEPEPLSKCSIHAWVWYYSTSLTEITAKCRQIKAAIGTGWSMPTQNGVVTLFRDDSVPFMQEQPDPDKNIRAMYLSMILHANTN